MAPPLTRRNRGLAFICANPPERRGCVTAWLNRTSMDLTARVPHHRRHLPARMNAARHLNLLIFVQQKPMQ